MRSFLWTLIVASFLCFFWVLFVRPTAWFSSDTGGHFGKIEKALAIPWHATEKQVKNLTITVMTGPNVTMVRDLTDGCDSPAASILMQG